MIERGMTKRKKNPGNSRKRRRNRPGKIRSVIFWKYDNYVINSPNNSPKIKNSRIA